MAKATTRKKTYTVTGRVHVDVGLEVEANSLEEAMTKAKDLKLTDFVNILGENNDSSGPEIVSIFSGEYL